MSLSGIVHVTGCPHYQGLSFRLRIRTGPQNRLHLCGHREAKTQNRLVQGWPRALRSPLPSCKTFLPNHKKDYGFSWKIPLLSSLLSALQISEWYKGKRRLKSKMEIDPATQVHLINDPRFPLLPSYPLSYTIFYNLFAYYFAAGRCRYIRMPCQQ